MRTSALKRPFTGTAATSVRWPRQSDTMDHPIAPLSAAPAIVSATWTPDEPDPRSPPRAPRPARDREPAEGEAAEHGAQHGEHEDEADGDVAGHRLGASLLGSWLGGTSRLAASATEMR